MKRTIVILCIALLALSTASAQITLGARAGLNMANISVDKEAMDWLGGEFKSHMGFNLGLVAEKTLGCFLIQAGLIYDGVGAKYVQETNEVGYHFKEEVKVNASYLSVPILAKYIMPLSNGLNLYGLAGPYLAFLLSGKAKGEMTGDDFSDSFEVDVKDQAESTDFGLVIGVGVQKVMGSRTVFVDLCYRMGLADGAKDEGYIEMELQAKNKIFSINVGVLGLI